MNGIDRFHQRARQRREDCPCGIGCCLAVLGIRPAQHMARIVQHGVLKPATGALGGTAAGGYVGVPKNRAYQTVDVSRPMLPRLTLTLLRPVFFAMYRALSASSSQVVASVNDG
ncbi:hypothetical protein D3C81_1227870 [compost metagenome]